MKKLTRTKGYTLLFSIIVAILVLSVAAFILSVSRKQLILSSASRDSLYAFYAADSGIECAVEFQGLLATSSWSSYTDEEYSVQCGLDGASEGDWHVVKEPGSNGIGTSTFSMPIGTNASGGSSCVTVSVGQWYGTSEGSIVTNIEARGYNLGWDSVNKNCLVSGARKVERALRLRYQ